MKRAYFGLQKRHTVLTLCFSLTISVRTFVRKQNIVNFKSTFTGLDYSISPERVVWYLSVSRWLAGSLAPKFLLLRSPVYTIKK